MVVLSPVCGLQSGRVELHRHLLGFEIGASQAVAGKPGSFPVAHRLKIEKSFAFQKTDSGGWRCDTAAFNRSTSASRSAGP